MKKFSDRQLLIDFLDELRKYMRESGINIGFDERYSSEFVDIYLANKQLTDVSGSLLASLKEIEALYEKLDAAYKKISPEATMMDFESGCYAMVKNIIARMEANNK